MAKAAFWTKAQSLVLSYVRIMRDLSRKLIHSVLSGAWFLHTVAEGQNEIGFRFCTVKNVQESSKVGVVI